MKSADFPSSRSDWAELDWKSAQYFVGQSLKLSGYTKVEEMIFSDHKRADVVVFRSVTGSVIFGIVEVKCYSKISPSIERKAMEQALGYLTSLYHNVHGQSRWNSKEKKYFAAIVFTKDYPALDRHDIQTYSEVIDPDIANESIVLVSSTPDSLIKRLNSHFPVYNYQSSLDDFI